MREVQAVRVRLEGDGVLQADVLGVHRRGIVQQCVRQADMQLVRPTGEMRDDTGGGPAGPRVRHLRLGADVGSTFNFIDYIRMNNPKFK